MITTTLTEAQIVSNNEYPKPFRKTDTGSIYIRVASNGLYVLVDDKSNGVDPITAGVNQTGMEEVYGTLSILIENIPTVE